MTGFLLGLVFAAGVALLWAGAVCGADVRLGSRRLRTLLPQSELPLTFGLGSASKVPSIEVTWPNGRVETFPGVAANQTVTVQEGKGILRTAPFGSR